MRFLSPAFTALTSFGIAACVKGLPYAGEGGRLVLCSLLVPCVVISFISLRTGALIACWALPVVWLIGLLGDRTTCFCDAGPPLPEYFGRLVFMLFAGSLVIAAGARPTSAIEWPRARVSSSRRPRPGPGRPASGRKVHGTSGAEDRG